jgi:hypothetical protein
LLDIGNPVWILGVLPPRIVLDGRRHGGDAPGKARLQQLVVDLRLKQELQSLLRDIDILRPFRDQPGKSAGLPAPAAVVARASPIADVANLLLLEAATSVESAVEVHDDLFGVVLLSSASFD